MLQSYHNYQLLMALKNQINNEPQLANQKLVDFLVTEPSSTTAMFLLSKTYQKLGNIAAAQRSFEKILTITPNHVETQVALAKIYHSTFDIDKAIMLLTQATKSQPENIDIWMLLANYLKQTNQEKKSEDALKQYHTIAAFNAELAEAEQALALNNFKKAEQLSRRLLQYVPNETRVMFLLSKIAQHFNHFEVSCSILANCVAIKPNNINFGLAYANALFISKNNQAALENCQRLLTLYPENLSLFEIKAGALTSLGRYEEAIDIYRQLASVHNEKALCLLRLGNVLKIVAKADEAVACYHQAIDLDPLLGEAYWNLANLKTYHFTETDILAMTKALQADRISHNNRELMNFAMGKALEDKQQFAESFTHYQLANNAHLQSTPYNYSSNKESLITFFTADYFINKKPSGHPSNAPIFIVGLPRSGSTLVEQILSSHSQVDGTMELTEIISIARELNTHPPHQGGSFPENLAALTPEEIKQFSQRYIDFVKPLRKNSPYFIDKLPNNFHHIGLIKTLFPQAKIIDVRRNPMASGWSLYKHFFAEGHKFSYKLETIGQYYNDYVELMTHWQKVLPDQILSVSYEELVNNLPTVTSKILDYCGLTYEDSCLDFHLNKRAVATASSEQVRQPIYTTALDHWQNYAPFLTPLKNSVIN